MMGLGTTKEAPMSKGQKPDFSVRVKVGGFWYDTGAAWHAKNGCISVKLKVLPIGQDWDGSILLVKPKVDAA